MFGQTKSLKYHKKSNMYKNSTGNVTFNPETYEAVSFKWWTFVKVIKGLTIFNDYNYSLSTRAQQSCVRDLMKQLNIKIDVNVNIIASLSSDSGLSNELENEYTSIFENEILLTRTTFKHGENVHHEIMKSMDQIDKLKFLGAEISKNRIKELKKNVIETDKIKQVMNKLNSEKTKQARQVKNSIKKLVADKAKDLSPIDFKTDELSNTKSITL
jgi:hypothetical protein